MGRGVTGVGWHTCCDKPSIGDIGDPHSKHRFHHFPIGSTVPQNHPRVGSSLDWITGSLEVGRSTESPCSSGCRNLGILSKGTGVRIHTDLPIFKRSPPSPGRTHGSVSFPESCAVVQICAQVVAFGG